MYTLREQLKDDLYKQWFLKIPTVKVQGVSPPWRVFVLKTPGSNLARVDFGDYVQAFAFVKKNLKSFHDMALHSKRQMYSPPVVGRRDGVRTHRRFHFPPVDGDSPIRQSWCGHCRRIVAFRYYPTSRHPNLGLCVPDELRCCFCGAKLTTNPPSWRI